MATNLATHGFGGEPFLQVTLPNHTQEWSVLTLWLVAATVFWVFFLPYFLTVETQSTVEPKKVRGVAAPKRSSSRKTRATETHATVQDKVVAVQRVLPLQATFLCTAGYLACTLYLLLSKNPCNYYSARRVYEAPLFSQAECLRIIEMSARTAARNYETVDRLRVEATTAATRSLNKTLKDWEQEPVGWHKTRHGNYPTTDLNLVTDPFSNEDQAWLGNLLDRRLAPTLARIYGVPVAGIRANDMFVVRYDADQRTHLSNHTDDADISFNVLLNDDFTGGGTRFWNRVEQRSFGHVQPIRPGQFLTHPALVNHEGYKVESGTRMILVGFLSVDRKDPFTQVPTGLNWYASWLSLPWMHVKMKEGYYISHSRLDRNQGQATKWADNVYMRALFRDMTNVLEETGDVFAPHRVENLVDESVAEDYLKALDDAYDVTMANSRAEDESSSTKRTKANWFQGQQLNLDVDGTIDSEWRTRRENADRFSEL
jgi:hypothetical protein